MGGCCQVVLGAGYAGSKGPLRGPDTSWPRRDAATRHKYQVPVKRSFLKPSTLDTTHSLPLPATLAAAALSYSRGELVVRCIF